MPADLGDLELRVLPPTLVLTAGFDPLCDEGRTLADAIEAVDVPVVRLHYAGQMHGFIRASAQIPEGREALGRIGEFLAQRVIQRAGDDGHRRAARG